MTSPHQILKEFWGYDNFRPLQEDIIKAVLDGKDTLALMPTGGGKSLCYQVPALAQDGLCLVISPLIALMKDQVENLRRKNITAFAIYSGMTRKEVINTFKVASESNCKFLYVSPERLETSLFKEYLPGLGINLIAVDEAHCISQWGYDFRPPYLRIAALREELPGIPILALTASATPDVQNDICEKLAFKNYQVFRQSFERPNLSYSTFKVDSKINKIIEIVRRVQGSSIIYCKSRKRTKEISELLQLQNISSDFYHAGLLQDVRNRKQEDWIHNKTRIIVCTNAFGMGIDKPDVRTVIHADVPDCLENYYQEAGRAGRDGKISYAVLLFDERDIHELEGMASLRFPALEDIRNIYQAVANYLQIPTGAGEGQYYDFDISDFLKKFKQVSHTTLYSLKALEQEGWLAFNEQVFLPSSVMFAVNKNSLYEFEKTNPGLEPCIKTLLRAYEGIFDQPTSISEKVVAGLMKKDVEEVKLELKLLNQSGIISYQPQKDSPQLYLLRNRIKAEDITIDMIAYNKRKNQFQQRMKQMVNYIKEEAECRSRIIGSYFGDDKIRACGICDNCLKQKAAHLTKEEFELLHHRIINIVKYESLHTKDLLLKLNGIKKEKAWKVIEFLQAENKIEMDKNGWVKLK
ncbi:MAG: RecQ family ATP-dependent DNA helicase [Chitinophagaceae bacterium]|nr:RecQ family ATP-dependent DNA helicase [Chitinophagaceae bacterium]MBK9658744.1 RecQ family ATP-dependent DNA helicase [Chitinophagaceae bacterium]MBK9939483.1 RecQ family ATP-dependent DNA helicase [Chitinophagaceae bacterium]